jgi:hypothetical protein
LEVVRLLISEFTHNPLFIVCREGHVKAVRLITGYRRGCRQGESDEQRCHSPRDRIRDAGWWPRLRV